VGVSRRDFGSYAVFCEAGSPSVISRWVSHPTLVFYHGEHKRFGAYLFHHEKPYGSIGEVLTIQEGDFLCGYHHGPYEKIDETFLRIRKDAKDLYLADYCINFNIVDQFVEHDNKRFITEVQIPILR